MEPDSLTFAVVFLIVFIIALVIAIKKNMIPLKDEPKKRISDEKFCDIFDGRELLANPVLVKIEIDDGEKVIVEMNPSSAREIKENIKSFNPSPYFLNGKLFRFRVVSFHETFFGWVTLNGEEMYQRCSQNGKWTAKFLEFIQ